jgi:hypothetical protein
LWSAEAAIQSPLAFAEGYAMTAERGRVPERFVSEAMALHDSETCVFDCALADHEPGDQLYEQYQVDHEATIQAIARALQQAHAAGRAEGIERAIVTLTTFVFTDARFDLTGMESDVEEWFRKALLAPPAQGKGEK